MAGLKALCEASSNLAQELKAQNAELFCAKVNDDFEDIIARKDKNLSFITSKLRLLKGKTLSMSLENINDTIIDTKTVTSNYTETVTSKLIEQQFVKTITQNDAVKELLSTPDEILEPELLERKKKILAQAAEFSDKELKLRHLYNTLKEQHCQLLQMRNEWDTVRSKLKNSQHIPQNEGKTMEPQYKKLQAMVSKLEQMRWMIPKLVVAKSRHYDWATDPNARLKILALTRKAYTVEMFADT